MTDRDALIARLRNIAAANVCDLLNMGDEAHEPPEITWGELDDIGRTAQEAADALSTPPPAESDDQTMSDAATLRGYIRTHGETPAMTWSSREHWKARAEKAETALPPPADPLPPRPTGSEPINRADLVRYGVATPGSPTLLTPMADGYWTPWHIAAQTPADPPALVALLKDTADALWGMQMQPDCWCPPGISGEDYHTDACRDARAVSKRLLVYPLPAAPSVTLTTTVGSDPVVVVNGRQYSTGADGDMRVVWPVTDTPQGWTPEYIASALARAYPPQIQEGDVIEFAYGDDPPMFQRLQHPAAVEDWNGKLRNRVRGIYRRIYPKPAAPPQEDQ